MPCATSPSRWAFRNSAISKRCRSSSKARFRRLPSLRPNSEPWKASREPIDHRSPDITELLLAWESGDEKALGQLTPLVYDHLRRLAQHLMAGERLEHTLQA